ncbi:MAG: ABC transporter ATP-binding protein [Alphaproteobacteria bacterium]
MTAATETAAINTEAISISFGGVHAVRTVSMSVPPGQRRVIIGPNGAGKTTFFNLIGGQLRPTEGGVAMFGTDITGMPPWRRARQGLSRTFQISRLFRSLSVWDNAMLAAAGVRGLEASSFRRDDADRETVARMIELLDFWGLADSRHEAVQHIAHGHQRLLEIALAFAGRPKVVMLDEPTAGLSGGDRETVTKRLAGLPRDVTILLVDHDMDVVFSLADRITVLNYGEVIADDVPDVIRRDPRVHDIYFGKE